VIARGVGLSSLWFCLADRAKHFETHVIGMQGTEVTSERVLSVSPRRDGSA
jgi:hypothetical protein